MSEGDAMIRPWPRSITLLLVTIALAAVVTSARAEPWRPSDPSLVLLRIQPPAAPEAERSFDPAGTARTSSLDVALARAAAHIEQGRLTSQPQGFGRAEALLESSRASGVASAEWHVLLADIQQYRHDYSRALALLGGALRLEPRHPRARLMRAAIHQTRGEFKAARADCTAMLGDGEQMLGTACLAQVLGLTGRLEQAYKLLARQYQMLEGRSAVRDGRGTGLEAASGVSVWILTALADMAERQSDIGLAERHLRDALAIAPRDPYVRLALADLLLESDRAAQVQSVLDGMPRNSATLLRSLEARLALGHAYGDVLADLQRSSLDARTRGEQVDWRDKTRLHLAIGRCSEALVAARRNWETQREPADVRLLARASVQCVDPKAHEEIRHWRTVTRYEDARLALSLREPA